MGVIFYSTKIPVRVLNIFNVYLVGAIQKYTYYNTYIILG